MSLSIWLVAALVLLVCVHASQVCACFAVIVGRGASDDGSVLVAHNEENHGPHVLHFRRVPRRAFPQGATVRLRRGGTLEQVRQTAAFLWSEIPGLESSDGYLNEHGVVVVSNGCPSREDDYDALVSRDEIRDGGIGYMLRRLVAERATTARQGVELAGSLVERFGYADSGRTYIIADPREAWLVAVVRGPRWVARHVPDDAVVVLPNVFILDEVNLADAQNCLGSEDLVEYAAKRGWFDPSGGAAFSFREACQAAERNRTDPRQWWGQQLLLQSGKRAAEFHDLGADVRLPWFIKPAKKLSVADLAAVLRDQVGPRSLFHPDTQEMAVFQLRAEPSAEAGCVYWRTTGRPDASVLTPWYAGVTQVPSCYSAPAVDEPQDIERLLSVDRHFNPPESGLRPDPALAWWKFRALREKVDEDYADRIRLVRAIWAASEQRLFAAQAGLERRVAELWRESPDAARRELTRYCALEAEAARDEADRLVERLRAAAALEPR